MVQPVSLDFVYENHIARCFGPCDRELSAVPRPRKKKNRQALETSDWLCRPTIDRHKPDVGSVLFTPIHIGQAATVRSPLDAPGGWGEIYKLDGFTAIRPQNPHSLPGLVS